MSEQNSNDVAAPSVAVIGMAGRLPGADSIADFWKMIVDGREGITFFSPEALDPSIDPALRANPNYVPAKGVVKDADCFDAQFFGISPMEAKVMDPQQRLSLEVCWHALEDAAVTSESFDGLIGVYAGSNWNRYRTTNLAGTETEARYGAFNTSLANEQEFLATRIAYKLDLRGPAIAVSSACSTSLVAIAEACKALFAFDCDLALAGGASISTPLNAGYLYQEGSMLSSDGHCRSFDSQASGTTFNDGVAYVVLKRTEDAIADGDQIYAVVRGFGVNNDGANKVSFTAPSVDGQAAAVTSAIEYADVDPATIGLIETHGTATPMGDPIEIEALKRAFAGVDEVGHCAIGSVKTNIGHVVHAAGAAGFIKAVMSVRDGVMPPSLFFEQENPQLGLADSPFFVNAELRDWPATFSPRRAGVSSFGVGGTNAHVIIEQAPVPNEPPDEQPTSDGAELMFLSARSPEALKRYAKSFADLPAGITSKSRSAIARVLRTGRVAMPHRMAWVADSTETLDPGTLSRGEVQRGQADDPRQIVFLCTGQGSQRIAMGCKLAEFDSVFSAYWTRGLSRLKACGIDLQRVLDQAEDVDVPTIQRTEFAQPALYLFEYAMGRSLIEAGVQPDLLIGHSIGEFTAAALAEVFSFEQGLDIVVKRGALMQAQPAGDMIAAFVDAKEAARYTSKTVAIAAENAPGATVLSGPETDMQELAKSLANDGVEFRPVKTSHAFHSSMMVPAATAFRDYLSEFEFSPPKTPIVSTVTAAYLKEEEATSADYWSDQLLKPVRFAAAVSFAQKEAPVAAVEVGPGKVLASLAKMSAADNRLVSHATAPDAGVTDSDRYAARRAAGFVWVNGGSVAAPKDRGAVTSAVSLPGYPFERTRHWVDERAQSMAVAAANTAPSNENLSAPMTSTAAEQPVNAVDQTMNAQNHRQQLIDRLIRVLEDVSGFELDDCAPADEFLDIGFDSILLTQAALSVQQEFDVEVTFRQLMEDYTSIDELVDFLEPQVQPTVSAAPAATPGEVNTTAAAVPMQTMPMAGAPSSDVQALIQRQLELMQIQLAMLTGAPTTMPQTAPPVDAAQPGATAPSAPNAPEEKKPEPRQGPGTRIKRTRTEAQPLTEAQKKFVARTIEQYVDATKASKAYVEANRATLADPRTVSGFSPEWKEMVYPIVTDRSRGSRITDIDGRDYIDITNGFGPILFGHSPDFITEAVVEQIKAGIETGPQSPLAGEVAQLCAELTGNERIAFASTGSEAVCCALRLARTVTGRSKVAVFEGSYHGIFDEVVVRPGKGGAGLPAAPGIPREMTANIVVLPWGTDEALERIREMAGELAAVMVEPVQSRNPAVQPAEFLQSIREITENSGTAFIFDEIVTGFRVAPGGAQAHFGIRADLATYGKVVGGGHPIGIIGGKSRFMDALDGGAWQFGDDSTPQVGVTFFAGTFVRHPVALAAARAVLLKLREAGPDLQNTLATTTAGLVGEMSEFLAKIDCPVKVNAFSSYFYISVPEDQAQSGLLFYLLRLYGIHTWQYRPCFLTTAHSEADVRAIADAFRRAVSELVRHGLLKGDAVALERLTRESADKPPVEGARLGKDASGAPAWFIADPDNPGKYKIVGYKSTG